jgi:hypothetical protein
MSSRRAGGIARLDISKKVGGKREEREREERRGKERNGERERMQIYPPA